MMVMTEIIEILKKRDKLLLSLENYEVENDYEILDTCMRHQIIIQDEIYNNPEAYPVDFILEVFTQFDDAPSVICDGAGGWSVCNGLIPLQEELEESALKAYDDEEHDIYGVLVSRTSWKPTIREALNVWLKQMKELTFY